MPSAVTSRSHASSVRRTHHALTAEPVETLEAFVATGGLRALETVLQRDPEATIAEVAAAGVRGRGGAGFPTGRKWQSLRSAIGPDDAAFVVVNGAEGEPGTFKDRALFRTNPYLVLEGALIAAHTLGVPRIVVATKARFEVEVERLRVAVAELEAVGALGDAWIEIVEGPDHYLFGEETALLEVIEGEEPLPRHLAPYDYGLFTTSPQLGWSAGVDASPNGPAGESSNPALVNNVETYAHVALVARNGAEWYRSMGTEESPGPTIVTITGDVEQAVVAEIELGATLRDVIDQLSGGVRHGRSVKAVLSGVSNPIMTADALDARLTYEDLKAAGGGLGSAGFIVFDDTRNVVDIASQVMRFLHVESCGQCTPCKTGTGEFAAGLERIVEGRADVPATLDTFTRRALTVTDGSRCYLPTQSRNVLLSAMQQFPEDVAERSLRAGDTEVPFPKLVDIRDGVAVVDEAYRYKRPDWTYAETPVQLG